MAISGPWALTEREQEVLERRLAGESFKSIAIKMGLGVGTVACKHYRAQRKLGARSFRGALRKWSSYRVTHIEFGINGGINTPA